MEYQAIFKRVEIKYLLTVEQANALKTAMSKYMVADKYGNSTICNLYFDTPDYLLVRRSIEKPCYKEKLRLRSYGVSGSDKIVFPELKKKYDGVVYKRRLEMTEREAMGCLLGQTPFPDSQIGREIAYCFSRYQGLQPKVYLSYERQAFYGKADGDFRMTFDKNILWRETDLSLCSPVYGQPLLGENQVLLEVKTATALPLWLVRFFGEQHIYKTSFSKYGSAYAAMMNAGTDKREKADKDEKTDTKLHYKVEEKTTEGGLHCA